jgi:ADP-heptose:LPS heptosyltransferase
VQVDFFDGANQLPTRDQSMQIVVGLIEHLGDIVACEPVARYLKVTFPDSRITWVVSAPFRELVDYNPFVDETVVVECLTDWMKLSKHGSYDKIVDLHVNFRICQHCRIPLVKETGNPFVSAFEWFDYGGLLEAFSVGAGLPRLSAQPKVYIQPQHVSAVDALNLPTDYCVIHRESNVAQKDWTPEGWQNLALLLRELKIPVVEVGAGIKRPSPFEPDLFDLFNRIPILQTAEVIRRARFFIGIDSGPAHLANAVQTPGVVLLGRHGNFRKYTPFTGFYASDSPFVKVVRNLVGDVRDLSLTEVMEAVRYVAGVTAQRDYTISPLRSAASLEQLKWAKDHRGSVLASGLFDKGWYEANYPEYSESGLDAVEHFLIYGANLRHSPGPHFDTAWYLETYPDVAAHGVNPLVHYLQSGRVEARQPVRPAVERQVLTKSYRLDRDGAASEVSGSAATRLTEGTKFDFPRTFAFYLPQFHPIPENDWAHGLGFSEWHNVVKAQPLFNGHHQPRMPGELGFYDLRAEEVLRDQIRLAQEHGISGFCFYYYYFQGKKLLFDPIRNFIESDIDAPFMFLWANENWSKRWDGGDREVIIAQKHSIEDDLLFIRELVPLFNDPRYVKVGGKPILLVYKSHLFENAKATIELWRTEIEKHGFPGIFLVMVDDWTADLNHPRDHGFDAAYEIPSNVVPEEVLSEEVEHLGLVEDFAGRIVDYSKFANFHLGRPFPKYKRFRTVMLPWDNTARYGNRAMVHVNDQGDDYKKWLLQALLDTYRRYEPEERIVFLHSWNEWCEGTYLEPDAKRGRAFLRQTRDVINIARQAIRIGREADKSTAIAEMLNVTVAKDIGAFRLVDAARRQTGYVWQELQQQRVLIHQEVRADFYSSRSWQITKPLRYFTRLLRRARNVARVAERKASLPALAQGHRLAIERAEEVEQLAKQLAEAKRVAIERAEEAERLAKLLAEAQVLDAERAAE